jgi:hydroxyacylglutathione hydrolase
VLFSGDTLFEGSYGRIDFPTGSGRQMIHSVADILLNLPDDTNVYPGHMGYTTIADEKQYNPLAGYRGREA